MSTRKLLVLTAIFAALLGFVVLYERHQPSSEEAARARKKLIDFKAEDVVSLAIERPDLPRVEVKKLEGKWALVTEPGGPAEAGTIDALLGDLSRLDLVGEVRKDFDPKEFGLDQPKAKAIVTFREGRKSEIAFGAAIPATDATAASEGGRFGAVKFAPIANLVKPVDEYRSKNLIEIPVSDVTRLTIVKGPNRVLLTRALADGKSTSAGSEWRIEEPVKDLAARTFVEQLLNDLSAARVTEFPALPPADYARVGLQPPSAVVTLEKGKDVASKLSFGAAKADAAGKIYALRDKAPVVVDDRFQDNLSKEFSAFREAKICPIDTWSVLRVSFDSAGTRTGAEKIEGEWRSSGRPVPSTAVEDLLGRLASIETKAFVARKDYAAHGIPATAGGPGKPPKNAATPISTMEVLVDGRLTPSVVKFYAVAPVGVSPATAMVAAEVSGRSDAMLVERSAVEELDKLAVTLRTRASETPTPGTAKAAPAPSVPVATPSTSPAASAGQAPH